MFLDLVTSLSRLQSQYPYARSFVTKAVNWAVSQPFFPSLKTVWNQVSFRVDFGSSQEFGYSNFVVTKESGSNAVYGRTARSDNFQLTVDGFVSSVKRKLDKQRSEAQSRIDAARQRAEVARREADEAERAYRQAESDAQSLKSVVF